MANANTFEKAAAPYNDFRTCATGTLSRHCATL